MRGALLGGGSIKSNERCHKFKAEDDDGAVAKSHRPVVVVTSRLFVVLLRHSQLLDRRIDRPHRSHPMSAEVMRRRLQFLPRLHQFRDRPANVRVRFDSRRREGERPRDANSQQE